ncbi:glycosyltransferase family 1 protein [Paenibacillus aurantius]|uniref:Glycosyltransferase family 1 protein n=1 Tax=Paenibacillus aurantius TaxID=2918900 RepID=A0AA96LEX8_9BACL|nr:glycosyltransferase family 1 protein [Paenibacillus aurantius]WNQ10831.1 glycosyltransferase family 1 protein [Paenibacillus aurantius]
MKKLRIGIDAQAVGTNFSGNEIYIKNVIKHLGGHDRFEYVLFVNENYNYAGDFTDSSLRMTRFKSRSPFIRLPIEFPYKINRESLDLLHVQYTGPFFASCPVVSTIHDISFEHYPEYFTKKEAVLLKYGVRKTAKEAAKIITVSEYSKQDIIDTYGVPEDKVAVTYNSIDTSFQVEKDAAKVEAVRSKYGIEGEYVLAVGNLQPRKNIPRLLQAYRSIRDGNPNVTDKLVIVGRKAWLFDSIFDALKGFKYIQDVIITDYVPKEDLPLLYNGAKLFVYPSIFEGFGLPVLEAMACGAPVVTSNTSCLPEIAGGAALLTDPFRTEDIAGGILKLLTDSRLRQEYSRKGLARAGEFSWEKTARQTMDIYASVV